MQFLCSFYGRTDEVARRFLSRILRTICETMSKQKSIFRRNSSVWLRWIQFFCDHSVSCNFTYPHDAWKIERQKILKTEKKKMNCFRVVNREPGRSADALQSTDACEIKIWHLAIRINIQILNRYTTQSRVGSTRIRAKCLLQYFLLSLFHAKNVLSCILHSIRRAMRCLWRYGNSGTVSHNKI